MSKVEVNYKTNLELYSHVEEQNLFSKKNTLAAASNWDGCWMPKILHIVCTYINSSGKNCSSISNKMLANNYINVFYSQSIIVTMTGQKMEEE